MRLRLLRTTLIVPLAVVCSGWGGYAGTITSGTISSVVERGGGLTGQFSAVFRGANDAGQPFTVRLEPPTGGIFLGNEYCGALSEGFSTCTWSFGGQPYTFGWMHPAGTYLVEWGGAVYDLLALTASFSFRVAADPVTVTSDQAGMFFKTYTFPVAPFAMAVDFTLKDGDRVLIAETLSGVGTYNGYAVGTTRLVSGITYDFVPEPGACALVGVPLLVLALRVGWRRRSVRL